MLALRPNAYQLQVDLFEKLCYIINAGGKPSMCWSSTWGKNLGEKVWTGNQMHKQPLGPGIKPRGVDLFFTIGGLLAVAFAPNLACAGSD